VGDFDGDGRLDVVVGSTTGARWVRNTDGTASGFVVSAIPDAPTSVVSAHARDINRDGRDDLITASNTDDSVDWWELVGADWVRHSLVSDFNEASAAVAGDVDGDGDLDVIGAAPGADLVTWWSSEVTSQTSFLRSKVDRAFDGARQVVASDINGDRRSDIVGLGATQLSWWAVMGSEGAPVYIEREIATLVSGRAVAAGDLNGDGVNDLVVADGAGVRVLLNDGDGTGWSALSTANGLGASGMGVTSLALGDVTGDGRLDIVGITPTQVLSWANSGGAAPSFVSAVVGTVVSASAVALGDTNGNGRVDIVVSNTVDGGTPGLQVFTQATAGAAFTATAITDAPAASHVVVGDVDGDGQAEIFSGQIGLFSLLAYWGWDGSAYARHVLSTEVRATFTRSLHLADVDGDGDVDLVVAFGTSEVRWLENVSGTDAGWVLHDLTLVGATGESLAAADFDADGDMDVVVAHGGDSEVVLYKNDGVAWWRPSGR
jgi:hypothetical protein